MRILVVESNKGIGNNISTALQEEGYAVDWVCDKESAETACHTNSYGMIVMELVLPDGSGFELLEQIRTREDNIPILIATTHADISYKIRGLDSGADDYLVKPFKLEELQARVRALHRRSLGHANPVLQARGIILDPAARTVNKAGREIELGSKEFSILKILMEQQGKVVSKTQLEDNLYGWNSEIESNTIEVHIHGLRKKLGKEIIQTVKYEGYRF